MHRAHVRWLSDDDDALLGMIARDAFYVTRTPAEQACGSKFLPPFARRGSSVGAARDHAVGMIGGERGGVRVDACRRIEKSVACRGNPQRRSKSVALCYCWK